MKLGFSLLLYLAFLILFTSAIHAKAEKRTSRISVSYEILGAGVSGSINSSYWFKKWPIIANLGVGYVANDRQTGGIVTKDLSPIVTMSGSYLYGKKGHYLEGLLGADITIFPIFSKQAAGPARTFTNQRWLPVIGLGYRYWPLDGGFHFRLIGYFFASPVATNPHSTWLGISLGYGF